MNQLDANLLSNKFGNVKQLKYITVIGKWHKNVVMSIVCVPNERKTHQYNTIQNRIDVPLHQFHRLNHIQMLINHLKWFRLHQRQISDIRPSSITILPMFNNTAQFKQQHQSDEVSNRKTTRN